MKKPILRVNEAIELILRYGGIDGDHHKMWVLDQVLRLLADSDKDYRLLIEGYENNGEYEWDVGIPP